MARLAHQPTTPHSHPSLTALGGNATLGPSLLEAFLVALAEPFLATLITHCFGWGTLKASSVAIFWEVVGGVPPLNLGLLAHHAMHITHSRAWLITP